MRKRRPPQPREHAAAQARTIGAELALACAESRLTERHLARRAGVARSTVRRIIAGDPGVQLDTLSTITAAAGLDLVTRAYPGRRPSLHDSGQLTVAEALVRIVSPTWQPRLEVTAGDHGRAADLVLFGPDEIIDLEIERLAVDYQAQYRSDAGKRDVLASRHSRPVRLVLVIEDTPHNRLVLAPHMQLIRRQLPKESRAILNAIRSGRPLGADGLLWIRRSRLPRPSLPKPLAR
jgi:transcriptional regulator with XRE-family HTH domain